MHPKELIQMDTVIRVALGKRVYAIRSEERYIGNASENYHWRLLDKKAWVVE